MSVFHTWDVSLNPKTGRVLRTMKSLGDGSHVRRRGAIGTERSKEKQAELRRIEPTSGEVLEAVAMPDAFIAAQKSARLRVIRRPK